jgi:hypothetical protein
MTARPCKGMGRLLLGGPCAPPWLALAGVAHYHRAQSATSMGHNDI